MKNILILFLVSLSYLSSHATIISVRLIKDKPSKASSPPTLEILDYKKDFSIVDREWYNGENDWEIFFEIQTSLLPIKAVNLSITANGVKIARALIGRTDVSFTQTGDKITLKLVSDTTDGRHVQTSYQNPKGGPHIWFYHNWEARRNGKYLDIPYPKKALAASLNYVLACNEMFILMGDMSGLNQKFNGQFILLNCESSAPRSHLDFPPHWHLEHWENDYNTEYGIDWRRKQSVIPHYYLDSIGNIIENKYSITQNYKPISLPKNDFFEGDTCTLKDKEGNLIFKEVIKNGGLQFIKPNGEIWSLVPDKDHSGSGAVWIYKGSIAMAKASVKDDGEKGKTSLTVEYYENGKKIGSWVDSFTYDRFSGKTLSFDKQ